ncbi:SAGA-associated factor 73 [Fulvia fulva]|uniref:SAGA-associated factor 73 n=2 Tax=Mycosphaerellaceae TaxID=93133 RepID=A0A9Q8LIG8_PASFU|nr:SAGA-associated factor 73 [Fulvia fulva]KAK4624250.1 SAGA-associated factor 73 [Fulvia fulva]KAK4625947.1 SAGA-associated factor 73 [Fulvia fulva]UJO18246.1 SAGA-associated factor 73 [Fulvia fulva]WPV15206.1 SAGA-associated factor 73 [Fulvia fulva]WPV29613.1 SAGA-associated factor 73 [Fulvia fulva]
MAPNGVAMSRKTPSSQGRPIKMEGSIALENLFDDLDEKTKSPPADIKKRLPLATNAGAWNKDVLTTHSSRDDSARSTPIVELPKNIRKTFPNKCVMADRAETSKCIHCKRAVSKFAMPKHIESCLDKKQEKQRKKKEAKDARDAAARKEKAGDSEEEEEEGLSSKKTSKGGMTVSKKRKAEEGVDDGAGPSKKKKKKDEPKGKAARPKAPVDVEKQCGVELPQGGQCARSLTCKSHSMGAKRAVPGRSAPYDKLLMEYQRKNQAKLQKAAFDANAPNPDDDNLDVGPVDSEEEKEAVMAAIQQNWGGAPLYQPMRVPLRSKYQYNRLQGTLFGHRSSHKGSGGGTFTFGPGSVGAGGGLFGSGTPGAGLFGSGTAGHPNAALTVDTDGMVQPRKIVVPGARSMMAPMAPSKRPSIASGS